MEVSRRRLKIEVLGEVGVVYLEHAATWVNEDLQVETENFHDDEVQLQVELLK